MQKQLAVLIALSILEGHIMASGVVGHSGKVPLRIEVVSGNGSVNSLSSPNVVAPLICVRTQLGTPVKGAKVRFELAGSKQGVFAGEQTAIETETDSRGEATAVGYMPRRAGAFKMNITASNQTGEASVEIHQRNSQQHYAVMKESYLSSKRWYLISGAAAALGAVILLKKSAGATPGATVDVPGTSTGGGR
ncbi:MAG: hypothetical protein ABJF23_05935 [Bryobacteraceae bacterium]